MCITKNGFVRRGSWTRETLSDAWESTNWESLCGTPWQMVAPELKLTKKVIADKEGAGPPLPRIVFGRAPEVEPRRLYVLSADIEAHGHTGGCPGCAALASHGRATNPQNDERRERSRTIIERTLTGKARMNASQDRIAETEQVKERKRARVERGAGDVPTVPGNRADEQVAVELTMRKFTKESTTSIVKGLYAAGMFTRCDQNRVSMFGRQRVSSQTVGESK